MPPYAPPDRTNLPSLSPQLAALRGRIAVPETGRLLLAPAIDAALQGGALQGGLPLGQMHEVLEERLGQETGVLAAAFAALLLGRLRDRRPILWVAPVDDLHVPGLLGYGLDPGRLVLVRTHDDAETLMAMEVALRAGGLCAVLGEVARLGQVAGRRLHLACLQHGITGFVLRRRPYGRSARPVATREGNEAATRWRLSPAPSEAVFDEPGPPRWRLELLHARGGREGTWVVQVEESENGTETNPLRVVAAVSGAAATAAPARSGAG